MMKLRTFAIVAGLACLPAMASAAEMDMDHAADAAKAEAGAAFAAANDKMMREMMVTLTGDSDRDFVTMMIPHHQGAIDMAKIVLQYGKDPEIRQLAEAIVAAQESEIAEMKAWLAGHGQ